tara:strand:+ start:81 stop:296 length:216 start_codon:yes stop_codon:yes gene_type:complete
MDTNSMQSLFQQQTHETNSIPTKDDQNQIVYLSTLLSACRISQLCQDEPNSTGQIDPKALNTIKEAVKSLK